MKTILKLFLAAVVLTTTGFFSSAQIMDKLPLDDTYAEKQIKSVTADNGHLWMDGNKLSDDDVLGILGEETYNIYSKARKQIRIGETTTTIGGTLLGTGIGYAIGGFLASRMLGNKESASDYLIKGGIIAVIGTIPLAIGLPVMKKGCKKLESIADNYRNENPHGTLSFGATGSGIGLCYRF